MSWFSWRIIMGNSFLVLYFALMGPKLSHCPIAVGCRELRKSPWSWCRLLLSPLAPILEPELVSQRQAPTQRRTPIHSCRTGVGRYLWQNASCRSVYHSWTAISLSQRSKAWSNYLTNNSAFPPWCSLMVWFREISWTVSRMRPNWIGTCCWSWWGHQTPWISLNQYEQSFCKHFFVGQETIIDLSTLSMPFQFESFEFLFGSNCQSVFCFPKCCLQSSQALPAAAFHMRLTGSEVSLPLQAAEFCGFRVLAAQNWSWWRVAGLQDHSLLQWSWRWSPVLGNWEKSRQIDLWLSSKAEMQDCSPPSYLQFIQPDEGLVIWGLFWALGREVIQFHLPLESRALCRIWWQARGWCWISYPGDWGFQHCLWIASMISWAILLPE